MGVFCSLSGCGAGVDRDAGQLGRHQGGEGTPAQQPDRGRAADHAVGEEDAAGEGNERGGRVGRRPGRDRGK